MAREPPAGREKESVLFFEVGAGWPYVAWHGNYRTDSAAYNARPHIHPRKLVIPPAGIPIWSLPVKYARMEYSVGHALLILPLRPIFPEALWSVGFFACLSFLASRPVVWWGRARRAGRARRGFCVKCRYPLGGLDVCPECGKARQCVAGRSGPQ